jgi:hypothetical protein
MSLEKQLTLALNVTHPVWVCNVEKKFSAKQVKVFATDKRFDWTTGNPRSTYAFNVDELLEKDIVGIYATRKRDTVEDKS